LHDDDDDDDVVQSEVSRLNTTHAAAAR